ncbi:MAG: hypothetical protein ACKVT0_05855 [Planctomycetaceae bacterium]
MKNRRLRHIRPISSALLMLIVAGVTAIAQGKDPGKVILVCGQESPGAKPLGAELRQPFGVDADADGNLFFVEFEAHRVLKMNRQGKIELIAGTGQPGYSGDGGPATKARFNMMHNLAINSQNEIFVADTENNCVRKIDLTSGKISTFAGTGKHGYGGDNGPANAALCGKIYCASFDPDFKTLYLADLDNRRIRAVSMDDGMIRTVAGNGQTGVPTDGASATDSPLVDPRAVACDAKGRVYVLERGGHALRIVDITGKIHTVAGTGKEGFSGDGGAALFATLNGPKHLCFDLEGNVLIADTENHVVRKYLTDEKTIVRVAGTGKVGHRGVGGPSLELELNKPHGVYVARNGDIYIADSSNQRILKIEY